MSSDGSRPTEALSGAILNKLRDAMADKDGVDSAAGLLEIVEVARDRNI